MAEFLPLCDVLFNVISLAGYFCDVVFDVVMGYALLERGYKGTFAAIMTIIATSLIISQVLSLKWYLQVWAEGAEAAIPAGAGPGAAAEAQRKPRLPYVPVALHCLQLGVLWRYAKLFVPVDLRYVKHEVRNLCMLRLVHAFCEAAPMLLLQLHLYMAPYATPSPAPAAAPAVPSVPALSSPHHDHLDPGLHDTPEEAAAFEELSVVSASLSLFSLCWALASFSKNVRLQNVHRLVLTWLGVIFQFVWRLGTISARVCALTVYALVYKHWVFLVIGLHWVSMFLWLISPKNVFHGERISRPRKAYLSALIAFVYVFAYVNLQELNHRQKMITFYCVMAVENWVLVGAWAASASQPPPALVCAFMLGTFGGGLAFMLLYYRCFHVRRLGYILGDQRGTNSTNASRESKSRQGNTVDTAAIPGVFNCRFGHPAGNGDANCRKKKKPTSFVPPPAHPHNAFWRRPLPSLHSHHGGSSENEGSSVGSRVNIQQKLQEKKQKQLAELRVIEEEIKQGKIAKVQANGEEIYSTLQRQPIPRSKTHANPHPYHMYAHNCNLYSHEEQERQDPQGNHQRFDQARCYYESPDCTIPSYLMERPYESKSPRNLPYETSSPRDLPFETSSPRNIGTYDKSSPRNRQHYESNSPSNLNRNYGSGLSNVNNNPGQSFPDVTNASSSYERQKEKPHLPTYAEDQRQYRDYTEVPGQEERNKEEYVSALQNMLAGAKIDLRNYDRNQGHPSNQGYQENRFPYPMPPLSKLKLEQLRKLQRCRTPEVLLAPQYFDEFGRQLCGHWPLATSRKKEDQGGESHAGEESAGEGEAGARDEEGAGCEARAHSDMESQISLPRSYTLPREFRYWRPARLAHNHNPSNNSSDGDVDSADNDSDRQSNSSVVSQVQTSFETQRHFHQYQASAPHFRASGERRYGIGSPMRVAERRNRRLPGFVNNSPKPETKL